MAKSNPYSTMYIYRSFNFREKAIRKGLNFVLSLMIVTVSAFSCDDDNTSSDCIDLSKVSNQPCPAVVDPVCGCNKVTYGNSCEAQAAGVVTWTNGICP